MGILLSPVLLFVLLTILIYLPPVQNWLVDKVAAYASEETGMEITVDHVDLSFPLDLGVDGIRVIHQPDTIADVERLVVDVQLLPLFGGKVVVNQLEIKNTQLNTNGFVEAAKVKGRFSRLFVKSDGIDLHRETVEVNGARLEDAQLDIVLNDSVPEDTTTSQNRWKIHIDEARVQHSDIALHMPGDTMSVRMHMGSLTAREAHVDLETETYTVQQVDWDNGALQYDQNFQPRIDGLDYNHLDLSHISIGIDSIYYHDPTLRLVMRHVALREKSGLQVTDLTGPVEMENGTLRLPKFHLKTPDSEIAVEMDMPLNLMDSIAPGQLQLRLRAQVGKKDVMVFLADMPQGFRDRWPDSPLQVEGALSGNMQHMEFSDVEMTLPSAFHATVTGYADHLDNPKQLRADVQFQAQGGDLSFLVQMLPRQMQRDYRIPNGIRAEGRVKADRANYTFDVTANEDKGRVKLQGQLNADLMRYDATLHVDQLNVHHFMPRDSIYTVTADVKVQGQGTDFLSPRTQLTADAQIQHLRYGHWNLDNMTAQATIRNGHALVDVLSDNPLVNGRLNVDALLNTKKLNATITADLNTVDLYKMRLVDKPLSLGLCGHVDVTSDMKLTHYVSGLISDITVRDSSKALRSEFVGLHLNTTSDTTIVRAQSGDFIVKLDGSGNYEQLLKQLIILSDSASAQLSNKIIDQPALRRLLPDRKSVV